MEFLHLWNFLWNFSQIMEFMDFFQFMDDSIIVMESGISVDISDLNFDLSLDLDLGGRIFKIAITRSIFELGPPDFAW